MPCWGQAECWAQLACFGFAFFPHDIRVSPYLMWPCQQGSWTSHQVAQDLVQKLKLSAFLELRPEIGIVFVKENRRSNLDLL